MRLFFVVSMVYLLTSCVSGNNDAEKRVADFYHYYLPVFANSPGKIKPAPEKMHDYVSRETLTQLDVISHIYEQEIIDTDYYTYAQDYSVDWIPLLKVGKAQDVDGSKYVTVWLGCENDKTYQIGVYLKKEDRRWKIYRVKNVTDGYEHFIFDRQSIEKAKQHAKEIE